MYEGWQVKRVTRACDHVPTPLTSVTHMLTYVKAGDSTFCSCGHELWLDIFESSVTALKYEGAATAMLDAGALCDTGNDAVVLPAPFLLAGGALLSYFRAPCRTSSPKWSRRTLAGLGTPHTRPLTTFQI